MEENLDTDNSASQANKVSDNTPVPLPAKPVEPDSENQPTKNMEVHHHSHAHGKRNWKSYIWEFLMLFLAVFCGFLAEYKLEHTIEHNREKEFVKSMIEDAKIDTANISKAIKQKKSQRGYIDSLIAALYSYEPGKSGDHEIYRLYRYTVSATPWVKPTERTLSQLKNSGGMRLIKRKAAADMIIHYDGKGKDLLSQQEFIDDVFFEMWKPACEIFNFKFLNPASYKGVPDSAQLLSRDKTNLIRFANMLTAYGGGLAIYCRDLEKMQKQADTLMEVLRKEYHLK